MAEDKFETREIDFRNWLPWTQLFRGFWIAFDYKKLALAAAGILIMALGWWLLAVVFFNSWTRPKYPDDFPTDKWQSATVDEKAASQLAWLDFKEKRNSWNLLHRASGDGPDVEDAGDLATTKEEFERISQDANYTSIRNRLTREDPVYLESLLKNPTPEERSKNRFELDGRTYELRVKPYGKLRKGPWFEDRGPNPFLLVTGQAGDPAATGRDQILPWRKGEFVDWFMGDQVPVLLEPLVKFFRPVFYILNAYGTFSVRLYFLLVILWTAGTWAFFGGAIARIAAVQIARNEKIGMFEALRFAGSRWRSYLFASFAPLALLAGLELLLLLMGVVNWIPFVGEFTTGIFWFLALGVAVIMAVVLIGLVGWPMIHATLGAEGSDSFDALSRSYSYVLQRPWSYLWYAAVAVVYGAVVVFFVGLMGSLTVYLAKWGVNQTPLTQTFDRDPSYMFAYAPTSFGWRDLLLQGTPVAEGHSVVTDEVVERYIHSGNWHWWNWFGTLFVSFWLYLFFLLIVGFGYSYFWSASTHIYFLMRRKVDDTEMDEVYLEEEDLEEPYSAPISRPAAAPAPASSGSPIQMVEPPALRPSTPPPPPPAPAPTPLETTAPKQGDGNVAATGGEAGS